MTPPILEHAAPLLANYDVLFCDVWGVVHNGASALPGAVEALMRFRARGGTVILVSNAPVPQEQVASMLDSRQVPANAWDRIVSSGDLALRHLAERNYRAVHCIGPRDRDGALFAKLTARQVALEDAEAIVCTGLIDDVNETVEDYRPVIEHGLSRRLPFVCVNPDYVVDVAGRLYLCAGAIADAYQQQGGDVFWAGKPYPVAYETALKHAQMIRGGAVPRARILVIGDAIRTDMKGAQTAGVDALFIASGIHRHEAMDDGGIDPPRLQRLFAGDMPQAKAAMGFLTW